LPAPVIERRVRAFDPFPGATSVLGGDTVKLWRARVADGAGPPGDAWPRRRHACAWPAARARRWTCWSCSAPAAGASPVGDFLRGHPVAPGTVLAG
jgi:methionyl-tRNA formyltransferase